MIDMRFRELCQYFEKIEKTSLRLEITRILSELFSKLRQDEVQQAVYILTGRLGPLYQRKEFGLAEKTVVSAVCEALSLDRRLFDQIYQRTGDIGLAVEEIKKTATSLYSYDPEVKKLYQDLEEIADLEGKGSLLAKKKRLGGLIREIDALSARYLIRFVLGRLRLGFSDMTILDAFSWSVRGDKSLRRILEKAYHVRPDLGWLASLVKRGRFDEIESVRPEVFVPIIMMRAERVAEIKEIFEKIGSCLIEPKYDGFRLQVHFKKGQVKLFSRNLEEVSFMYPDIVEGVKAQVKAQEMIFEGEAIGFDPESESFLPFQETVQRRRKYNIDKAVEQIPLKFFVFELLYRNGENFIDTPFYKRREVLEESLKVKGDLSEDILILTELHKAEKPDEAQLLFDQYISEGLEGIMAKKRDGIYKPAAREWNWIKFKRSYSGKLEDTIDAVVMGYYHGRGKRSKFGIGAFLVGVYDDKEDVFKTIARIGTGLTDEQWRQMKRLCDQYRSEKKPGVYEVDKQLYPDVWVKPALVVEIRADEITRSPVHTAGRELVSDKTDSNTQVQTPGFALRFPRLERVREDKRPEDATSLSELKKMFSQQFGKK